MEDNKNPDMLNLPKVVDNSGKEPVTVDGVFTVGVRTAFSCPFCGKQLGHTPEKVCTKMLNCPKCRGRIILVSADLTSDVDLDSDLDEDTSFDPDSSKDEPLKPKDEPKIPVTPRTPVSDNDTGDTTLITDLGGGIKPAKMEYGKVVIVKKWGLNKSYPLEEGSNVIGRYDVNVASKISIKDDKTVSRRSIDITVERDAKGIRFKLTVLKATNPVMVNNKPLNVGESMYLNFGDSIILGETQLRLEKDT